MALTDFKDARTGLSGPVAGALVVIPFCFSNGTTGITYAHTLDMPAGMNLELVAIDVNAVGITSDPSLTIGTSKAGTQIVAAANVTTNLGALTLKATSLTAGGELDIRVINDGADDDFDAITVTVFAYVSAPPTSVALRS